MSMDAPILDHDGLLEPEKLVHASPLIIHISTPGNDEQKNKKGSATNRPSRHRVVIILLIVLCYLLFGQIVPHGGGWKIQRAILFDAGSANKWNAKAKAFAAPYMEWLGQAHVVYNTDIIDEIEYHDRSLFDETQYWGRFGLHGIYYNGTWYNPAQFRKLLARTGTWPRPGGVIWLRTSAVPSDYAERLATLTECYVVCNSNDIGMFQGSAKAFSPNGEMLTPDDVQDFDWFHSSKPWDKRTILASQMNLPKGILLSSSNKL